MAQSSLFYLALLTIKSEILDSILNDKIINQFALAGLHKILLGTFSNFNFFLTFLNF